jgi:dolichol-phosphate mannosyltransferase
VFDRACRDGSDELLREAAVVDPLLIPLYAADSRGPVDAYLYGFRRALADGCRWVLEIDGGFSHDPRQIPRLLHAAPGVACVFGSRFIHGGRMVHSPWRRRLLSQLGTLAANTLLGTKLHDMTSGFELFEAAALRQLLAKPLWSTGHFFQTEVRYRLRRLPQREVPITYSSPSFSVRWRYLLNAISGLAMLAFDRWQPRGLAQKERLDRLG